MTPRKEGPVRRKLIVGNWKMFTTAATARRLAADIVEGLGAEAGVEVIVCPPCAYLAAVGEVVRGSPVALGARNVYPEKEGRVTGETGLDMLLDLGCRYVIVGHSERRRLLGEDEPLIRRKARAGLAAGLGVIACVGETQEQRRNGETRAVLEGQLAGALDGLTAEQLGHLVVAYEPVWAIGTGQTATPAEAQEAAAGIRAWAQERFGAGPARVVRILDGGSVTATNAAALLRQPDIDGALIGGASLVADQFLAIVRAAGGGPALQGSPG
jgi:triosephosphate isomerase